MCGADRVGAPDLPVAFPTPDRVNENGVPPSPPSPPQPSGVRAWRGRRADTTRIFEVGLRTLLDGLATLAAARGRRPRPAAGRSDGQTTPCS
ncbi:hypothetical protein CcI49_17440 [Frankia sp. CcI49]|nr:hypothetical protein CcI49_17440 [Frankia sp. CcI49]